MTDNPAPVEVWYRNPHNYIRELVECGESNVVWHKGRVIKSKIDPIKHASLYFGSAVNWRVMVVGHQGAVEYRPGDTTYNPTAVYPIFEYGEDLALLEELMASPLGEDEEACSDTTLAGDERPVFGQENRVIITNIPVVSTGPGRQFLARLNEMQEDYPDCILHLHNLYSYRVSFGMSFRAADVDPRTDAAKGRVYMPTGAKATEETAATKHMQWLRILGFKPVDLREPRNRCMFNIKSASWAAKNYRRELNFRVNGGKFAPPVDHETPDASYKPAEGGTVVSTTAKAKPGDKFACDTCSLSDKCKYFRAGSVCTLPSAEPKRLADYFKTRDSDQIIEGLSILTAANARRLERGMEAERVIGDTDKEVTKVMGQLFKQGVDLAKLIDPNLRGGAKVQVNVGSGGQAAIVGQVNPKQLVAGVIRELESQGYSRDQITPEMITNLIRAGQEPEQTTRSIEAGRIVDNGKPVIEA